MSQNTEAERVVCHDVSDISRYISGFDIQVEFKNRNGSLVLVITLIIQEPATCCLWLVSATIGHVNIFQQPLENNYTFEVSLNDFYHFERDEQARFDTIGSSFYIVAEFSQSDGYFSVVSENIPFLV